MQIPKGQSFTNVNPSLAEEWHPTKNIELIPDNIKAGSDKKVWWLCRNGHEWMAVVKNRVRGNGCPYCAGQWPTLENCLGTRNPAVGSLWHPVKNDSLTPFKVLPQSNLKVWWKCPKEHEWEARIADLQKGQGCPYCSGRRVNSENCIATTNPSLVKEWHSTKNNKINPFLVTSGSHAKVWWVCTQGHEWQASVYSRSNGNGCPFCAGQKVSVTNCLASLRPDLAREWHQIKNKNTPYEVTSNSNKKAWWICNKGHSWEAKINGRFSGNGCPYCSNQAAGDSNNLALLYPDLLKEWNYAKNEKSPSQFVPGSNKKVWWLCSKKHEWFASIANRVKGVGCPYCSNQAVSSDNCLAVLYPDLSKEWHPNKNIDVTPHTVVPGSGKKVWWVCSRGHEWLTSVNGRVRGNDCPYCGYQSSVLELRLFSELEGLFKDIYHRYKIEGQEVDIYIPSIHLAIEVDGHFWHQNKIENEKYKNQVLFEKGIRLLRLRERGLQRISDDIFFNYPPNELKVVSEVIKFILDNQDLDKSNKERLRDYLENKTFINLEKYNLLVNRRSFGKTDLSLAEANPAFLSEWHPTKNGVLSPENISYGSGLKVWWQCKDGHEWLATVDKRNTGRGCPYCAGKKINATNSLKTLKPLLAAEWDYDKNILTPEQIAVNSNKVVWWKCKNGHEWKSPVVLRSSTKGICPSCRKNK